MEMSACAPLPPRSRKSTEGVKRKAASSVETGAAACAFRSKSGVDTNTLRVGELWLPAIPTSSICNERKVIESTSCAATCRADSKRMDIDTESTPIVT